MRWLEITISTRPDSIDSLCAELTEIGVSGLVIESETEYTEFLQNNQQYWDYIDEELQKKIRGICQVKFYLSDDETGKSELTHIQSKLTNEKFFIKQVQDEDWENNWRQYYKPITVGKRLLIVPEWEKSPQSEGRSVLRLDPGLIFGTGTHATTQMCLRALEKTVKAGKTVLDLGCGSGILGIAALLLGAEKAVGCDIDPKAPNVAMENARLNQITSDRFSVFAGDVLGDTKLQRLLDGKYDIVLANIVADVIISLCRHIPGWLQSTGVFICSGIIDGRQNEVKEELVRCGLEILETDMQDGWYCFMAALPRKKEMEKV